MHQHREVLKAIEPTLPPSTYPQNIVEEKSTYQIPIDRNDFQTKYFIRQSTWSLALSTYYDTIVVYGTWMHPVRKYSNLRASSKLRLPPSTLNKWEYAPGVDGKWLPIHGPSSRVMYMYSHTPLNMIQSSILLFQRHLLWYSYYDKVYSTPRTPRCWIYPPCSI